MMWQVAEAGVTDALTSAHVIASFDCARLRIPREVAVDGWTGDVLTTRLLALMVRAVEPST